MKLKKIQKIQKPIEIDCHLKYTCPDQSCGYDHWINLNQARTKNYKIVCDCGVVFTPKKINTINIVYDDTIKIPKSKKCFSKTSAALPIKKEQTPSSVTDSQPVSSSVDIPLGILKSCIKILESYGFTNEEAEPLLKEAYKKNQTNDCGKLIKFVLENIGVKK